MSWLDRINSVALTVTKLVLSFNDDPIGQIWTVSLGIMLKYSYLE